MGKVAGSFSVCWFPEPNHRIVEPVAVVSGMGDGLTVVRVVAEAGKFASAGIVPLSAVPTAPLLIVISFVLSEVLPRIISPLESLSNKLPSLLRAKATLRGRR